ncbi:MAG: hypothetical protein H7836_15795 [Magnetococcus sp. YQC-3]
MEKSEKGSHIDIFWHGCSLITSFFFIHVTTLGFFPKSPAWLEAILHRSSIIHLFCFYAAKTLGNVSHRSGLGGGFVRFLLHNIM